MGIKSYYNNWNNFYKNFSLDNEAPVLDNEFPLEVIKKGDKILEIGFGPGRVIEYFLEKNYDIFGADISSEALNVIRRKEQNTKNKILSKICLSDCLNLAFKEKRFAIVICLGLLEHFETDEQVNQALSEIERVLQDSGKAIITLPHRISAFIMIELFKRMTKTWYSGREKKFFPHQFIISAKKNKLNCIKYYCRPMDISPAKGLWRIPARILQILDSIFSRLKIGGHMVTYILEK